MKRLVVLTAIAALFVGSATLSTPVGATSSFNKEWRAKYADREKDPDYYKVVRKASCNVCHVKGVKDKKSDEAKNEYGKAVANYLDAEELTKEFIKENPEKAAKMIQEGFKKANEMKSKDGDKFGEKIKADKLPATDANL